MEDGGSAADAGARVGRAGRVGTGGGGLRRHAAEAAPDRAAGRGEMKAERTITYIDRGSLCMRQGQETAPSAREGATENQHMISPRTPFTQLLPPLNYLVINFILSLGLSKITKWKVLFIRF